MARMSSASEQSCPSCARARAAARPTGTITRSLACTWLQPPALAITGRGRDAGGGGHGAQARQRQGAGRPSAGRQRRSSAR
eukprot:scaffold91153_cov51-Phaeocystis_antarctica.AAC.4